MNLVPPSISWWARNITFNITLPPLLFSYFLPSSRLFFLAGVFLFASSCGNLSSVLSFFLHPFLSDFGFFRLIDKGNYNFFPNGYVVLRAMWNIILDRFSISAMKCRVICDLLKFMGRCWVWNKKYERFFCRFRGRIAKFGVRCLRNWHK